MIIDLFMPKLMRYLFTAQNNATFYFSSFVKKKRQVLYQYNVLKEIYLFLGIFTAVRFQL